MNSNEESIFLGWNIGGTQSSATLGTARGTILEKRSWPSQTQRGFEYMIETFYSSTTDWKSRIAGIGVSIGGPLDPRNGIILSPPNLPGWNRIPLKKILSEKFTTPVTVEHDAVACLLAERLWGAAKGYSHSIYLTAGTGCGAGIIVDNRIVRGPAGQTTEIGHIRLTETGPVLYGKAGSVETYCSGTGLSQLSVELYPEQYLSPASPKQLVAEAKSGKTEARVILSKSAWGMGRTCALLTDLFSPQILIIGSLARYLPSWWLEMVKAEFSREVLRINAQETKIVPSALGDTLQDLSSLAPCLFDFNKLPHPQ